MRGWLVVVSLVAGCGHDDPGDLADFDAIEVEPDVATLTVPLGGSATQDYRVFGVSGDRRVEVTAQCALAIDAAFGGFAGATLTAAPHGGKTPVVATCGPRTGQGLVVVNLVGAVVVGGTPAGAQDLFDTATAGGDPARTPVLEYPIDKAVSPRNIPPVEVQWTAAGNDLFHVALVSTFAHVDIYTTTVEAALAAADWDAVAGTAAGETLAVSVEGLAQSAPATKFASATANVTMSHDNIDRTAIYYWASSQGSIMTQAFGEADPPDVVKADCTSCHSVSRAGTRIGYSRCVANDCGQLFAGFLRHDGLGWSEAVDANAKTIQGSYTTFAPVGNPFPDDTRALAIVSMASGALELYDPDTGAVVPSNIAVATVGGTRSALMADWSPDGSRVVFATTPTPGQWIDLDGGRIATMSYTFTGGQHVFGTPQPLVADPIALPTGTYGNFFFPSFSPDGALVVFDAARSGWRNFTDAHIPGQRLMLADAGGAWTIDLPALDGGTVDSDITWAHWAPAASSEYYWIVFSSERDYGHRTTVATSPASCKQNGVQQCKQIWLAAIAKNRLDGAQDPSAPPMWLPGQDALANNISPFWSVPAGLQ